MFARSIQFGSGSSASPIHGHHSKRWASLATLPVVITAVSCLSSDALADRGDASAQTESLQNAIRSGDLACVETLLGEGADVRGHNKYGTALHTAALWNRDGFVHALIEAGADVEAKDENGYTPLLVSVGRGRPEVTRVLIAHGASVEARLPEGMGASSRGCEQLLPRLRHSCRDRHRSWSSGRRERFARMDAAVLERGEWQCAGCAAPPPSRRRFGGSRVDCWSDAPRRRRGLR
jgi:hypothetical protein